MNKPLILFILLIQLSGLSLAQSPRHALEQARLMANALNDKDAEAYVNWLAPTHYTDKSRMIATLKKVLKGAGEIQLQIQQVIYYKERGALHHAVFSTHYGDRKGYFYGQSENGGKNWFFSQPGSAEIINTEYLTMIFPEFDFNDELVAQLDPGYARRINIEEDQEVVPFHYTDINGNVIFSEGCKGKVVVVNFWSLSCGPCRKEIPQLNSLVEKFKAKEVVFVALTMDSPKEALVRSFLPAHPFKYQIVLTDSRDYNIFSYPTHIIIDQQQKVVVKLSGASEDNIKKMEETIERLL
ncbi:TlpA family protein disulfide reductase [Marinilabiliaceae bacterium JC017]|nr:TlpA family protein disulfide reductase [Marinilabiliaceae bacterium JC017]